MACSDGGFDAAGPAGSAASAQPGDPAAARPASTEARRKTRPLPAFEGATLDGEQLSVSSLLGRRLLLFFFNPSVPSADVMADAVSRIEGERGKHNFGILGVAMSPEPDAARSFLSRHGLEIPTLLDSQGAFIRKVSGRGTPTALILTDAQGDLVQAVGPLPTDGPDPVGTGERLLREWLRLPTQDATSTAFGERPPAPPFEAPRLEGGEDFALASLRGRPTILIFFLHTCPHCHKALASIRQALKKIPEARQPALIGISAAYKPSAVRGVLQDEGLDFFPVVFDPTESIREAYGALSGVPVIFLLDAEQRIVARVDGWRDDRDPPLMRMRLSKLAGVEVPMLLHSTGYSGTEFCAVCHESEEATWELTNHATAFDTLVRHGADGDPECVGCHVVGYGKKGGWSLAEAPMPELEDVGCENCHGRGGPHLSPGFVKEGNYEPVCLTCHNPTHSLGFDYASFVPRISHAANLHLAKLPEEERNRLLADRRRPRKDLLPTRAAYVGSESCKGCHAAEYEVWSKQPHARALATLAGQGEAGNAECLQCHTTGMGRKGFRPDHPDGLGAVGCEACHGPGGDHVGPEAVRRGTILSLSDKCDSCVILQICGGCHDDANDPGFEFEVLQKIEAQRHGKPETAERAADSASASSPAGPVEARALPGATRMGLLERALTSDGADAS